MEATQNTKNALDLQCLPSLCRGTYNRVARGERASKAISEALRAEI